MACEGFRPGQSKLGLSIYPGRVIFGEEGFEIVVPAAFLLRFPGGDVAQLGYFGPHAHLLPQYHIYYQVLPLLINIIMSRPDISISHSQVGPNPPISPNSRLNNSRTRINDPYLSRYAEELPEDRLHKSKSRSKSIKLNQSAAAEKMSTTVKVNENVVTVKEDKVLLNSTLNGSQVPGFQDQQYQEKKFKKFSITALIKEKDLVKESNYFDESHLGEEIRPVGEKSKADFRIGEFEQLQTFQVKTFLFDRNLTHKIDQ